MTVVKLKKQFPQFSIYKNGDNRWVACGIKYYGESRAFVAKKLGELEKQIKANRKAEMPNYKSLLSRPRMVQGREI